jgi:transcriptional regulator
MSTTQTSTTDDQLEKHYQVPISNIERKLRTKIEQSKNAFTKAYEQCMSCINATRTNLECLWQ